MPGLFFLLTFIGSGRPIPARVHIAMAEPTTNALMISGIITLTLLAIFLRKKLG